MKSCIVNSPVSCSRMRYLMNTFCSIQAEGEDNIFVDSAIEEAFAEVRRLEGLFSRYQNNSQVSKLNQNAAVFPQKVDTELFSLISRAQELSECVLGGFDISVGAAVDFWRMAEEKNILPDASQVDEITQNIGFKKIILDFKQQSVVFAKEGVRIDLGAIAKGYALDKAVEILRRNGITKANLNFGGHIYIMDILPQIIAIRNPLSPDDVLTTVSFANKSISTSANYERFFTIGAKRFGHLINPLSGWPVESDILSASVISRDSVLSDALSTAFFVLGLQKSRDLLKAFQGIEAVVICKATFTKGLKVYKMKGG